MQLHKQVTPDINTIRALEESGIKINDDFYRRSLLVTANSIDDNWGVDDCSQIDADTITRLLEHDVEVILVGTGKRHQLLDPALCAEAINRGVGIEFMTTEAACHTYNILIGEDRSVLAALIIET
jgi:uncharacterized protein